MSYEVMMLYGYELMGLVIEVMEMRSITYVTGSITKRNPTFTLGLSIAVRVR